MDYFKEKMSEAEAKELMDSFFDEAKRFKVRKKNKMPSYTPRMVLKMKILAKNEVILDDRFTPADWMIYRLFREAFAS